MKQNSNCESIVLDILIVFGLEVLSLTKSRLFHLAMVLVLTPKRCAKVVTIVILRV
jgi:hypothetical protein